MPIEGLNALFVHLSFTYCLWLDLYRLDNQRPVGAFMSLVVASFAGYSCGYLSLLIDFISLGKGSASNLHGMVALVRKVLFL